MAASVSGYNVKGALLEQMSREQVFAALQALENTKSYHAAATLAKAVVADEPAGEVKDTLALAAARNIWLVQSSDMPEYKTLLSQATQSSNADVAAQAALWREATTLPNSYDALLLAHRIWETVHLELSQREKSWTMSYLILKQGPGIYESVKQSDKPDDVKQPQLGQIASMVSEAAYQQAERPMIEWAAKAVEPLAQADTEDKLTPNYFLALNRIAQGDYVKACTELENVFMSGYPCDVAANAGYLMADCFVHLEDPTGAMAALKMLIELYPGRAYVTPAALRRLHELEDQYPHLVAESVKHYIDVHYRDKLNMYWFSVNPTTKQDFINNCTPRPIIAG